MANEKTRVRFTFECGTKNTIAGMVQTEDGQEREKRALLDGSGVAEVLLPEGTHVFVWAVKMTPIRRHNYSVTVERIPDDGEPVELRKRPAEGTTTGGEDVGFDDFTL